MSFPRPRAGGLERGSEVCAADLSTDLHGEAGP